MKTILLILFAGSALVATAQSPAQQQADSTSQTPYENKDDLFYQKLDDMIIVPSTDIPPAVLTTLKRAAYRGWEKGEMYRSSDSRVYELRIRKEKKLKRYRFDPEGNLIKEK